MKRLFIILSTAAFLLTAGAQARIEWKETEHDFGVIREVDGLATVSFSFVNTGDKPLVITGARANCGCTTPKYSREAILPGQESAVEVSFDPVMRPGRFQKKIIISTNAEPSQSTLVINGSVIGSEETIQAQYPVAVGPMRIEGRLVPFGEVGNHDTKGKYLRGCNASSDTLRPMAKSQSRLFHVAVSPEIVPPGEVFIFSIVLSAEKGDAWGPQTGIITLYPNPGSEDSMDIEASCNVQETFKHLTEKQRQKAPQVIVSPDVVDLGIISAVGPVITRKVKISNRGADPLLIRRVYVPEGAPLTAEIDRSSIKKDKSEQLEITIDPSALAGLNMVNAEIQIITNDPDHPVRTIRIVGEVSNE